MKFRYQFGLVFLLVIFCGAEIAKSQEPAESKRLIIFSTPFLESMSVFSQMTLIYTEAFNRIGLDFKMQNNPGERSLIEVDSGKFDGEAARIKDLNKKNKYPNLIRVNEPIATLYDGAYSTNTSIEVNGWASLRGTTYEIGIIKGVKSVEKNLVHHIDPKNIVYLANMNQLTKMLLANRIDLFIISTQIENSALMKTPQTQSIKRVGIAGQKILYPYIHKKHMDLIPKLAVTLKAMKKDGTYDQLFEQAQKEKEETKK